MHRYISCISEDLEIEKIDFLIVGGGIAGLFAALKTAPYGKGVIIIKEEMEDCNTYKAQGGIAAALEEDDSPMLHLEDTLKAGAGLCNRNAVKVLVEEGPVRVKQLLEMGVPFDRTKEGIAFTREGAHSRFRILRAGGDATGREIWRTLSGLAAHESNLTIFPNVFVLDIITDDTGCRGVLAFDKNEGRRKIFLSDHVVIATGGAGQVFFKTTNAREATGDGIAMAYRAGAVISDMEFVQFHPTALFQEKGDVFLISESVRGEGGILRNAEGESFMPSYHPMAELAPRDVVSRAIKSEMEKSGKQHVYLDTTHLEPDFLKARFPTIFNTCADMGIDIARQWIPVAPAAHYTMGGIKIDLWGRTNIKGLYACGEAADSGVHGANRLASNSLLEGVVFGGRVAEEIAKQLKLGKGSRGFHPDPAEKLRVNRSGFDEDRRTLKKAMTDNAGIIRSEESLKSALDYIIRGLNKMEGYLENVEQFETVNMFTVAFLIASFALNRTESRGAHFRKDHPDTLEQWKFHQTLKRGEPIGKSFD